MDDEQKVLKETGDVLELKIESYWVGKNIIVMPHLSRPTKNVAVDSYLPTHR